MFSLTHDLLVPIALLALAFLAGVGPVVTLFVIIGYGHFVLGYVYKIRREWFTVYTTIVPLSVLVFFFSYFFLGGAVLQALLATQIVFATHFAFDEFFVRGVPIVGTKWLTPLVFVALVFVLTVGYMLPDWESVALLVGGALLVLMSIRLFVHDVTVPEQYLALCSGLLYLLAALGNAELIIGVIVLLHCYNWYVWGHRRATSNPRGASRYWRDVVLSLGLIVLVYGASFMLPTLAVLFSTNEYFYVYYPVALAHIATSVRFGMLRG